MKSRLFFFKTSTPSGVVRQLLPRLVVNVCPSKSMGNVHDGVYPDEARSERLKTANLRAVSSKLAISSLVSRRCPPFPSSANTNSESRPTFLWVNRFLYFRRSL